MDINAEAILKRLIEAGEAWADAEAAASLLEETKSNVLAQLTSIQLAQGADSYAKAESAAKGTEAYKNHIVKMCEARQTANKAMVRWKSGNVYAELLRSQEASKRAGLKAIGG